MNEAPEQIPDHSVGGAVALGGDASAVEVEEITRVPPRLGPEEVVEPVQVGWFEDGEPFEVDDVKEEEEMKRLLDPLLDVQGLVKVSLWLFVV